MIVVMGVSGSGKSVVGAALAAALGVAFGEGDDLHPAANRAKMAAGEPLTDADRAPWLDRVAEWMAAHPNGVVACSALKRAYRSRLAAAVPEAWFVLLEAPEAVLAERLARRRGHFMPAHLLGSQLATLEPLGGDERGIKVANAGPVTSVVATIRARLRDVDAHGPCA